MMPTRLLSLRSALVAAAALQTVAVGWMLWDRISLLSSGREIRATVVPVDPRDVFRGDYVVLGYAFSTGSDVALPDGTREGDTVYALLKSSGPADWTLSSISASPPTPTDEATVVLKAVVDSVRRGPDQTSAMIGRLRYGIERFYIPEGTGRAIESQVREKRIVAVLAVGSDGKVALKGLEADGSRIADEPLL
jgi:uncharacterized membrane-anchored protein